MVTQHAIQNGHGRRTGAGRAGRVALGVQVFHCAVQRAPHARGYPAHQAVYPGTAAAQPLVHHTVHASRWLVAALAHGHRQSQHRVVHGLHNAGDAQRGVHQQLAQTLDIGEMNMRLFHGIFRGDG